MENGTDYRITTVAQLRALLGDPGPVTPKKLLTALDELAISFIRRSPFLMLGTADAAGNQDCAPKGDAPGFVEVIDANTLLMPERKGNKLLFTFQNILENPHVGMIFMVPGTNETLRVNGTAEIDTDPLILKRMAARGNPALMAVRVTVQECFFHCAKALIRSQLWRTESWGDPIAFSWGKYLAAKMGHDQSIAGKIDVAVEQDYKNNL
ncbi:MAG: MSMEG_1061 family FMN-dependent PPOX-type flavoprotein [Candidatus Binataceae bacterium]